MSQTASPGSAQRTFEAANSSEASIVKPVAPKNVIAEFTNLVKTGNRYEKGAFDDDDAAGKAAAPPVPSTRPASFRQAAPLPPKASPSTEPPAPRLPRQDSGRSRPQAPASKPAVDADSARVVAQMQEFLRREAAQGRCPTVGELSASIRDITGQSWGGYWEAKLGDLLNFIKSNPAVFTVVKNKYVVEKGNEDLAYRALDRELAPPAPASTFEYNASSYAPSPFYDPATAAAAAAGGVVDNPFETSTSSTFGGAAPPMYGSGYGDVDYASSSFLDGPSPFYEPNPDFQFVDPEPFDPRRSLALRDDSNDWAAPPMDQSWMHPPSHHEAFEPLQDDPFFSPMHQPPGAFFPPGPPAPAAAEASDDWWSAAAAAQQQKDMEERMAAEKAARRAAKADRKRQEESDAIMARELQEREFQASQRSAQQSAPPPTSRGVALPNADRDFTGEHIVLSAVEMRDLAEKELGRDNVRIIAGFTVRKYGREGRPHQRKMWITQSLTHLAWSSSLLEGSHRGIEIKHVTDVQVGVATSTILKSTTDRQKIRSMCLSLVTQSRTLDMQACSVIQRDALVAALKAVIAFNQKYRPEKVDRDLTRVRLVGFAGQVKKQ